MALTVPDPDDYRIHIRRATAFDSTEAEWVEHALQRATDLARIATGLTEDPVGPDDDPELPLRILNEGIFAMAHAIDTRSGEDSEAMYSPYSSERLGSYSYSKAMQAVQTNAETGVPWFDQMVSYFRGLDTETPLFSVRSEHVFTQPYTEADTVTYEDPSVTRILGP